MEDIKILFATSNQNKVNEIQSMVPEGIHLISLKDIDFEGDIPETSLTIEGNAIQKTDYIVANFRIDGFADDTGLEIEALNNEPGVYSARYAGEERDSEKNMSLVLEKMNDVKNRNARFKTVISLFFKGERYLFEGVVEGEIASSKTGTKGFGYDPIFIPNGYDVSFAEMDMDLKNKISHRGLAFSKMISFFQ